MYGITIIDAYSVVGAMILAGLVTLFGVFAVYGEASLRYYKLKNRLGLKGRRTDGKI